MFALRCTRQRLSWGQKRRRVMGDKSKKDKDKGAKQSAVKQQQKEKAKSEKQPKKGS